MPAHTKLSILVTRGAPAIFGALALLALGGATAAGQGQSPSSEASTSGWVDDFNGNQLDLTRWVVANGQAPGYIPGYHKGYYLSDNVSVQNGFLTILLTQEIGQVDTNPNGVISKGGLIYTNATYGYGTYQWSMRMSSTASSPDGPGDSTSGSVSAGFVYVNNSQTEIDFEFSGLSPETLWLVNWRNPNPSMTPTSANETYMTLYPFSVSTAFHTYKLVWTKKRITFYVDNVQQAVHTTNVPTAPAYFMINHWGTDSGNWGGAATVGTPRYFYVDWVSFTPPQ